MHEEKNYDETSIEKRERRDHDLGRGLELLRIHRSTISRYAKSGELRSYQSEAADFSSRRMFGCSLKIRLLRNAFLERRTMIWPLFLSRNG